MLKSMKFLKASAPYMAGEVAGFDPAKAKDLERRGIAVPYSPEASAAAEKPAE